ncbi:RNA polymerase sigma factor [uncultured Tateyamaria sp.]|uniref:RNA polymerase sigma factor n=1 Tax=uncultured Tateyamaria sp. TaxID=455651 RepID=UPI0026169C26|nr:RNA polymerase sigma factor [uncultured Tateyamaria sp.]
MARSAKIPGLFKPRLTPHLGGMMEHKHPNPQRLVPLIPILNRRARRLTRSPAEAEDLVQDTLLSLCQRIEDGSRIEDLPAYAMRTLSNRARRGWRAQSTDELEDDHAVIEPDALIRLDCADTLEAIAQLSKPQRQLMDLVVAGETSPRALAKATGLPLGTVMSRLARARARLRLTLSDEGTPPA